MISSPPQALNNDHSYTGNSPESQPLPVGALLGYLTAWSTVVFKCFLQNSVCMYDSDPVCFLRGGKSSLHKRIKG